MGSGFPQNSSTCHEWAASRRGRSVRSRVARARLHAAAALVVLLGFGLGEWRASSTDTRMRADLLEQVADVAGVTSPDVVAHLTFTLADEGTLAFEQLRKQLVAYAQLTNIRGIYTMAARDGKIVFGPENYTESDPQSSSPGTVYKEPPPGLLNLFESGGAFVEGPYTDEYGTFVSAFTSVEDSATGDVLLVVGLDVEADEWRATVSAARWPPVLWSLGLVCIILMGRRIGRWYAGKVRSPVLLGISAERGHESRIIEAVMRRLTTTRLLIGMGGLAVAFLVVVLARTLHWTHEHVDHTADLQARLVVTFDKALRDYVGDHIRPEMEKRVGPDEFIPEAMSTSFVARRVFEAVQKEFPDSIVRFPSTNPRNSVNRATPAEERIIRFFEENPEAESWSGVLAFFSGGEQYFARAIPRRFNEGCLRCHGRPEDAPASIVERYGATAGFGRSAGEVSIELAAIPVSLAYAEAKAAVWQHMMGAVVLCVLFLGGIMALIWLDRVQRRRSEQATRENEKKLSSIIEGSPLPTFIISKDHRVTHWNRALEQMTGISASEVVGTSGHWRAFYDAERPCLADLLIDEAREAIPKWYRDGHSKSSLIDEAYELTGFFPEVGREGQWLHLTAAAIRDHQGLLVAAMETLQNISEQKRAEAELRERVKELSCLQKIRNEFQGDQGIESLCSAIVNHLASGMQFPSLAVPVVTLGTRRFGGDECTEELICGIHADIDGQGEGVGRLSVFYTEDRAFFPEEQELVDAVARILEDHLRRIGAEEALRESRLSYIQVVSMISDVIWRYEVDGHGRFVGSYISPVADRMLGVPGGTIGDDFEKFFAYADPEDAWAVWERLRECLATVARNVSVEYRLRKPNGTTIWVRSHGSAYLEPNGHVVAFGVTSDITESKLAEDLLRRERDYSASIISSTPAVICGIATDGTCTFVNPAGERVTGYAASELVGRSWWATLYLGCDYEQVEQLFVALKNGPVRDYDMTLTRKDGQKRTLAWNSFSRLDQQGGLIEIIGFGHDITERKQAEEALRARPGYGVSRSRPRMPSS